MKNKIIRNSILVGLLALFMPSTSMGASLIGGLDTNIFDSEFGDLAMARNDDGSSNLLNLPFDINFFGSTYSNFYINNNGNLTFNTPLPGYTPVPFPVANQPMIAPYWADVDTRCLTCGEVYVGSPNSDNVIATWHNVGYFSSHNAPTNSFQVILTDRSDVGAGDFDVEFRYESLNWTTGDASGGSGGLGGTPAQAGYDAGDGANFLALPGSFTSNVLDLQNNTNVAGGEPGQWRFQIRNGELPGSSITNPLLPTFTEEGFEFDFNVDINEQIWIDPFVAIGYDYIVNSGPNINSVELPVGIGDGLYDLLLWDGFDFVFDQVLSGGVEHIFASGGVDRFRILGIETGAGLDPDDPLAFITALTFTESGVVNMNQNPIEQFIPDTQAVPEPSSVLLLGTGLFGLCLARRKRLAA